VRRVLIALALGAVGTLSSAQGGAISWESTGGPMLPVLRPIYIQQARFLLTDQLGQWWRSVDSGVTWQKQYEPSQPRFLSANDRYVFGETIDGAIRSGDLGGSWEPCGPLPVNRTTRNMVTSIHADRDHVYAVVSGLGLFRSDDQCATWNQLKTPWTFSFPVRVRHVDGPRAIVVANGVPYISNDTGNTWNVVDGLGLDEPFFATTCDRSVLAGTANGLMRSRDGGRSWTSAGLMGRFVRGLVVSRCNQLFAVVQDQARWTQSVFRSENAGVTWTSANNGLSGHYVELFIDHEGTVYAAGSAGAFRWLSDGQWQQFGPNDVFVSSVAATPWGDMFASGHTMLYAMRGSGPWRPLLFGHEAHRSEHEPIGGARIVFVTPGQHLLVTTQGNEILRSVDRGNQWRRVGLYRYGHSFVSTTTGAILAGTEQGIFKSSDDGQTWIERSVGLTSFQIRALAIGADRTIYAADWKGGVFRSTHEGDRWRPMGTAPIGGVHALLVMSNGALLAGSHSGLFRWEPVEQVWQRVALTPERVQPEIRTLIQTLRGVVLAGTDRHGVFASLDEGSTWQPASDGLKASAVYSFTIDAADRVLAGTSAGVFRSAILP
jgi:photosystem II stability/assembly factor-like uncharacterized protein